MEGAHISPRREDHPPRTQLHRSRPLRNRTRLPRLQSRQRPPQAQGKVAGTPIKRRELGVGEDGEALGLCEADVVVGHVLDRGVAAQQHSQRSEAHPPPHLAGSY